MLAIFVHFAVRGSKSSKQYIYVKNRTVKMPEILRASVF